MASDAASSGSIAIPSSGPEIAIAKWFDNATAAISITYDANSYTAPEINRFVAEQGMVLDYELISRRFWEQPLPDWIDHDLMRRISRGGGMESYAMASDAEIEHLAVQTAAGMGYFGHGHWHVNHDALTYDEAYQSFRLCYEIMEGLGLPPVAYGYPRGAGHEPETQQAVADAGFLAARLGSQGSRIRFLPARLAGLADPYIVPDADVAPENWYALPTVIMESYDFQQCDICTNNTRELIPILDGTLKKTAWTILMYHSIDNYAGYGYYEWNDFRNDMRAIAERDFWVAPMNQVVLYVREREKATVEMDVVERSGLTERIVLTLSDGLDNARFNQPLSLLLTPPADWVGMPVRITPSGQDVGWRAWPNVDGVLLVSVPPNGKPYLVELDAGNRQPR